MTSLEFPKNFLWGCSTSSYQVEGGIENNDWSKKFPAGKACDHYHRFKEDFDLLELLSLNAYRFSIEWSRIEPEEGKFNQKEIDHYKEVVNALRKRRIEPLVTLWHFTNPLWFAKQGGWVNKKSVDYFSSYAKKIVKELEVNFWITINEPLVYASHAYYLGEWPPQKKNLFSYFKVIRSLIKAHKEGYEIIKEVDSKNKVGIAKNNIYFEANNNLVNKVLKRCADWHWNNYFLNQISNYQDFIGLNYYFHNRINYGFNKNENKVTSDLGWEIYPKGIYYVLKDLKKYNKPIFITENGVADSKDKLRKDFIKNHLYWIYKAIEERVNVKGYFHWSLMDNFEWTDGFGPRFGLVEINYENLKRIIRSSAFYYGEIAENNSLSIND